MEKVWKDGHIRVELNEEEKKQVENVVTNETVGIKEVVKLLKIIIHILTN